MFCPAGEEPLYGDGEDESSEDDCIFNGGIEQKKHETKPLFTFDNGLPAAISDQTSADKENTFKKREYVFAQTSMMNEDFRMAVVKGNIDKVKQMIESGFDVKCRLKSGWTPLMYACESGNVDIIQLLLNNGADPNSHKDMFSSLMCLCTCKNCYNEEELGRAAELLIEKGARVNSQDRHFMTSLMYACQVGHLTIVRVLLSSKAGIDNQDTHGFTALCYAAAVGNSTVVNVLLNHGGNPKLCTNLGDTPSSLALTAGYSHLSDVLDGRVLPVPLSTESVGHCVSESVDQYTKPVSTIDYSTNNSRQLGDMELFLAGLKLRHLEGIFQTHCVDFSRLLSLTDKDLDDMGITQVGVKRTLLDAITDLHKTSWKMPDKPFEIRRGLSIQEYSVIICQMAQHINYVGSSATFLVNNTSNGPSPVTMVTNEREQKELIEQMESVVESSTQLQSDISALKKVMYKDLGRCIVARKKRPPVLKMIGITFGAIAVFGLLYYNVVTRKLAYKSLTNIVNRYFIM